MQMSCAWIAMPYTNTLYPSICLPSRYRCRLVHQTGLWLYIYMTNVIHNGCAIIFVFSHIWEMLASHGYSMALFGHCLVISMLVILDHCLLWCLLWMPIHMLAFHAYIQPCSVMDLWLYIRPLHIWTLLCYTCSFYISIWEMLAFHGYSDVCLDFRI